MLVGQTSNSSGGTEPLSCVKFFICVAVLPWVGWSLLQSTTLPMDRHRSWDDYSQLLTGQALTPVVPVPCNHMPLMALMQLGIQNKTQTTFPLKTVIEGALMRPRQDNLVNRV